MHDRPICFQCTKPVETNAEMVFEAPCGCDDAPSVVFHPLCLFDWREKRDSWAEWFKKMRDQWESEHHQGHEGSENDHA